MDAESKDNSDRMTALFGNDWRDVPYETFMCGEKYRKMSTSIQKTQRLQCDSSSTLSQKLVDFTKNVRNPSSPLYWPVVKCVTIKVPNNDLLRHVTLVDLPGTGDRNKTRNDMWKEMLSSCGTVWIVTDMTRPESDKEPWEILQSACSIMGNGGECRNIRFICTKADQCLDELSPEDTKADIIQEFQALSEVQNHFPEDGFKVSIVSTKEEIMPPEKNEISDLEEFLESLNNPEERVQRYVSDAYGILALMMGARSQNAQQKTAVFNKLIDRVKEEIKTISTQMEPVHEIFDGILTEGVNLAKQQWEFALDEKLGSISSYKKLRGIISHNGVQETKTGDHINLNTTLSSFLTNSIDRRFRETFPNTAKEGPFYGAVHALSLDLERLIENNKDVELLLKFLKREEEKLKVKLCEDIRRYKKQIYRSLTETVTMEMSEGYTGAKHIHKSGAVEKMKQTLKKHVRGTEGMFDKAKNEMLKELKEVTRDITTDILKHLINAMNVSLNSDMTAMPDVTEEFNKVTRFYNGD
uniref:Uncharacterized protein n=1 Tax=Neogobius melanostomus TaxID=47308 RepID=A0A8C6WYZ2_9GOBI